MKIVVTGGQGFLGTYICLELLKHGHKVISIDNYSKYGEINRPQDNHSNFDLYLCDIAQEYNTLTWILLKEKPDIIIAGAAMIGGIGYFNKYPYKLLATNERILANTFDAAINLYQQKILKQIIVISSSMVFERATDFPSKEIDIQEIKLPITSYGFQKLSCEYFAKAAYQEYKLPYNIIRPFNCVGAFEEDDKTIGMTHVLPDLVNKIASGQNPVEILGSGKQIRCYTNGTDIGRFIRLLIESSIINEDFNVSSDNPISVLELAEKVWIKLNNQPFNYKLVNGFNGDIEYRWPDTIKAKKLLGFEAEISLDQSIDEVISYIRSKLNV